MRLLHIALLAVAALAPCAAHSQSYPTRPIRIIIPFPPGNTVDIMARLIAPKMTERLHQNIIVDNRAGASGQLGLELGAHAPPDGYTLVGGQGGNLVVAPHTYKKLPYDPIKDFAPIALSTTNYLGLVINPSVPFKSVKDLVTYAKAHPGKVSFASNGEGGFPHMTIELLRTMAGFTYLHVPYKGSAEIATQLIGGHVDAAIDGITGMTPHIRSGKLRLLGVTNPTRVPQFPDVPAIAESVPGYDSRGWFGFLAPAGTPREIVNLLNQEINRAMALPDVKDKLVNAGLIVVTEPPEFFAKTLKSDYEKYGKLIRDIGFQPQ
ncbi:MAG TPA: tripartite tricarboxylate transporter substrate binding protein [Burkholderiales bacterium]|nr:tripartite tricarboxylate transporter substrate binding protein [Burkholderiales bacterium]